MGDPIDQTQLTYDEVASVYARRNSAAYADLVKDLSRFAAGLRRGSVIADIGCGPGRDTSMMRDAGFNAIGLDLSLGQLRAGGLSGVVQADMRHLPLRTRCIDAIWCQAALLHIPHASVPDVLTEFARVAKIGSPLHLLVTEGDGEGWEAATAYGSDSPRWFTYHWEPDLTALLARIGFRTAHVRRQSAGRIWLTIHAKRGR